MSKKQGALTAAFVGGGGKTSLIFSLAEKFSRQGKRVIVTTTTHMAWEPERPFTEAEDIRQLCRKLDLYGSVTAAHHEAGQPKISGPGAGTLEKLSGFCDLLLVEADGSRRMPLKIPAAWEPVIPDLTDVIVGVVGLDCIGKRICDTAHRPEDVAAFLGKKSAEIVTPEDVAGIVLSEKGLRKDVKGRPFLAYLNKEDTLENPGDAAKILERCRAAGVEAAAGSLLFMSRQRK